MCEPRSSEKKAQSHMVHHTCLSCILMLTFILSHLFREVSSKCIFLCYAVVTTSVHCDGNSCVVLAYYYRICSSISERNRRKLFTGVNRCNRFMNSFVVEEQKVPLSLLLGGGRCFADISMGERA